MALAFPTPAVLPVDNASAFGQVTNFLGDVPQSLLGRLASFSSCANFAVFDPTGKTVVSSIVTQTRTVTLRAGGPPLPTTQSSATPASVLSSAPAPPSQSTLTRVSSSPPSLPPPSSAFTSSPPSSLPPPSSAFTSSPPSSLPPPSSAFASSPSPAPLPTPSSGASISSSAAQVSATSSALPSLTRSSSISTIVVPTQPSHTINPSQAGLQIRVSWGLVLCGLMGLLVL